MKPHSRNRAPFLTSLSTITAPACRSSQNYRISVPSFRTLTTEASSPCRSHHRRAAPPCLGRLHALHGMQRSSLSVDSRASSSKPTAPPGVLLPAPGADSTAKSGIGGVARPRGRPFLATAPRLTSPSHTTTTPWPPRNRRGIRHGSDGESHAMTPRRRAVFLVRGVTFCLPRACLGA